MTIVPATLVTLHFLTGAVPPQSHAPAVFEFVALSDSFVREADSAYRAKSYLKSGKLFAEISDDWYDPSLGHYQSACAYALAGRLSDAFLQLELSVKSGFRDVGGLAADTDLISLHSIAEWPRLVDAVAKNETDYRREHSDPAKARFVTSDIDNYWRAYDAASRLSKSEDRVQAYRTEYFDRASDGLVSYYFKKIRSIEQFAAVIDKHPRFYASLRGTTRKVPALVPAMRTAFHKMKDLYENAVFPDVYFVVGSLTSAGTTTNRGLLLGVDQSAAGPESPRDELDPSVRAFVEGIGGVENLPSVVAHELVHFQQMIGGKPTLLRDVLVEGGADFIGELISGRQTNPAAFAFGEQHEAEVWRRFAQGMHGTDEQDWIANRGSDRVGPQWVADLGYYVGYKITKAYYDKAGDKRQAIRDLLELRDPDRILLGSGYTGRLSP